MVLSVSARLSVLPSMEPKKEVGAIVMFKKILLSQCEVAAPEEVACLVTGS